MNARLRCKAVTGIVMGALMNEREREGPVLL